MGHAPSDGAGDLPLAALFFYRPAATRLESLHKTGTLADFVLLDHDITTIAPEEIRRTQVLKTVVGGRVVFSRE